MSTTKCPFSSYALMVCRKKKALSQRFKWFLICFDASNWVARIQGQSLACIRILYTFYMTKKIRTSKEGTCSSPYVVIFKGALENPASFFIFTYCKASKNQEPKNKKQKNWFCEKLQKVKMKKEVGNLNLNQKVPIWT